MQAELNLSRGRSHGTDQAKRTVVYTTVGVPVADNVEDVEEVGPETEDMLLFPQMEVLKQGHVDLPIAWRTLGTVMGRSKRIRSRHSIGADPVVRAGRILRTWHAGLC
jgi:hypothetical protein